MRRAGLVVLALLPLGCRAAPPASDARTDQLEARIAQLEKRLMATTLDDEILSLELQRAGMLVTHMPDHPAVLDLDRQIAGLGKVRELEARARREAMARRLDAERDVLLGRCTPDHPSVRELDAKIAFLRSDAR